MRTAAPRLPSDRYTRTAIQLHWLVAGLIACAFAVGWLMMPLSVSPFRLRLVNWHKWIGISVLLLAVLRILWRLTHSAPELLPMPRWQRQLARGLHGTLYVLLFAMPISGWLSSNAAGYPIVYFGLIRLPTLVGKDKGLSQALHGLHHQIGWLLLLSFGLHLLAIVKHHFIDGDATLSRMLSAQASRHRESPRLS
jgi:cytochrome b561